MCLSTAYSLADGAQYKIGEYISNIEIDGGEITLTDIMGSVIKLVGTLKTVDLSNNVVIIETDV